MLFNKLKSALTQTAQKLTKRDIAVKLHTKIGKDKLYHFHGGLHLELGKHLTNKEPVHLISNLNYYLINMIQHKGPKPISLVNEGDKVSAGQLLTSNYIPGELPIHSPVAGKIITITEYLQASAIEKTCQTIVVENSSQAQVSVTQITDFTDGTPIGPAYYQPLNYLNTPRIDLLWRIKNAGIAGLGGGVFPSAKKINNRYFKTLLVNAAECEPYITCDDVLMQNYAQQIVEALCCMQHLLQTEQVVVAIEDDKLEAKAKLEQQIHLLKTEYSQLLQQVNFNLDNLSLVAQEVIPEEFTSKYNPNVLSAAAKLYALERIKLRVIPTRYPSGNQRTTIEVLTGLRLTKKQNLTSLGAICFNVGTIYSMYRAIAYGEVLTQRLVTITGDGIKNPGCYWLPFGATPALILDLLGAKEGFTQEVIMGGPMMGFSLDDLNTPINKATNCLIFVGKKDIETDPKLFAPEAEQACIRCTACQEVCPMLLQPQQMHWFEKDKDDEKLIKANLSSCIECGLCDYVCPSNIPLVSYFQQAKFRIWNERKKVQIADESKIRFEIKSHREQIAKAERDAKRAADKQRNLERAQQMREKAIAESGIDPIEAAKARLKAKGVSTGQTTAVEAGTPDNSSIMEQRRLRRLQKQQQAETQATSSETKTNGSTLDRAAVLAAVARAKAKQAGGQPQANQTTTNETKPNGSTLDREAVLAAVARAKAKQAGTQPQASQTTSEATAQPMTAVQKAVALAKAKQAEAQKQKEQDTSETTAQPMNAVQRAVALAKAKQAEAQAQKEQATSETTAQPMNAVQRAVALAKAKQAEAQAQKEQATSETTAQPMNAVQKAVALAKAKQAEAQAQKEQATSETPAQPMNAVQRAVALAKAKQAEAQKQKEQATSEATAKPMNAVQRAVALAKTKQAEAQVQKEQATSETDTQPMTAVQRAVAIAKAKQAEAQKRKEQATSETTAQPMNAVQRAVALAKAKQAEAQKQKEQATSETAPQPMTAVQRAVALAKAKQAAAQAQQANSETEAQSTTAVQRAVAKAKSRMEQQKEEANNQTITLTTENEPAQNLTTKSNLGDTNEKH
ncbi:4Fe-4S dicluster domain-containing protein [Psittacicella gerlachiana]|uniref:Ion-translocating oxidoreductase complex subunit C n=1 Tax=Psittacicella gerlachiana TaxID=2028574 RepID=A0A3A1YIS0_9GAMM|nr:4Fe-4S dicluster domain-containing protein [Psittacicella gerlachiana]RIY37159.1 hypothetical protein CKF59_01930 [Psittacicella gerlachiana]